MPTFKLLVLAVIAALTLLAATASQALAVEAFQAAEYPAEIKGEQEGTEGQMFVADKLGVKCKKTSLTGFLEEGDETLEVAPTYSECSAAGLTVTVTNEECNYRLYAGTSKTDVVCPEGKVIRFVAGKELCEFTIGTQSNVGTVEYVKHEGPPQTLTMKSSLKEIKYNKTKDNGACPFSGTGEKSDGTLSGLTLMKAFNNELVQKNLFVGAVTSPILCMANENPCMGPYNLAGMPETIKCFESTIEGTTNSKGISSVLATITTFSLKTCNTMNFNCNPVKFETPLNAHIYAEAANPGSGSIQFYQAGKNNNIKLTFTCGLTSCEYLAPAMGSAVKGGASATMTGLSGSFGGGKGANCGANATFSSTEYTFKKPVDAKKVPHLWITP